MNRFEEAQEAHFKILSGSFHSGHEKRETARFIWSDILSEAYWNHATDLSLEPGDAKEFTSYLTDFYVQRGRIPAVYLTPESHALRESFIEAGFKDEFTDCWMFLTEHKPYVPDLPQGIRLKRCLKSSDFEDYIEVFFQAFGGSDQKEPYGALPLAYKEAIRLSFGVADFERELFHFLLYDNDEPAGCALLGLAGNVAGLYSLGVIPSKRGRGFARILTNLRVEEAFNRGADILFLLTEQGSYNEQLFASFGFKIGAVCMGLTLKSP